MTHLLGKNKHNIFVVVTVTSFFFQRSGAEIRPKGQRSFVQFYLIRTKPFFALTINYPSRIDELRRVQNS